MKKPEYVVVSFEKDTIASVEALKPVDAVRLFKSLFFGFDEGMKMLSGRPDLQKILEKINPSLRDEDAAFEEWMRRDAAGASD